MKKNDIIALILTAACALFLTLYILEVRSRKTALEYPTKTIEIDTVYIAKPQHTDYSVITQRVVRLPLVVNTAGETVGKATAETSDTCIVSEIFCNFMPDSAEVTVPIERKVYADSTYRAVISGYMASLDTIEVYNRHTVTTYRRTVTARKRWGIGISAGYAMTPKGFNPYVGIGVSYNILMF